MNQTPVAINLMAVVPDTFAGMRVDQALAKLFPQYSRARLQSWLRAQQISINGETRRPRDKVRGGEQVEVRAQLEAAEDWTATDALNLDIIYEDDSIMVINKQAGLVVHPAIGHRSGTLINALLHHAPMLSHVPRAGVVHRLDKDTSGLLVIAKSLTAHHSLVKQLSKKTVHREYHAIVHGVMIAGGRVDAPIGRHPTKRTKMAIVEKGKPAISHYRVIERFRAHSYIKVLLETGRTHQIRVHLASIYHPLVGDPTYGRRLAVPKGASEQLQQALRQFKRQALHAYRLTLHHPETKQEMSFTAPIPNDMQILLDVLHRDIKPGKS